MENVFEILKDLPKPGDYVLLTVAKGSAAGEKAILAEKKIIWESKENGFFSEHFSELNGKTWGIIGLGAIGRRVAQIAEAFGAHVIYYSASGQPAQNGYTQVDLDTLLTTSDIISVHAPLNEYTENLLDKDAFAKMKKSCIFLNLGRGPIVVEQDLYDALITDEIAAAGLDVLCQEPMSEQNPLFQIKDSRKLLITPHIAWAGIEARMRLMDIILNQIKDFFEL